MLAELQTLRHETSMEGESKSCIPATISSDMSNTQQHICRNENAFWQVETHAWLSIVHRWR